MSLVNSPRSVTILGSTGSIGTTTLDIIRAHRDKYHIKTLMAYANADLLVAQAIEFGVTEVVIIEPSAYQTCKNKLSGTGIKVHTGEAAMIELAAQQVDITVSAIVGVAGLRATLAAISGSKIVALANKESVVCGGPLLSKAAAQSGAAILPVDSEHCAILQAISGQSLSAVERITLTASGGPCRNMSRVEMSGITPDFAIKHPTWKMGPKISVDCATLFNKGLEVIEAYYFFPLQYGAVEVVIHPESVLHSMVTYCDGSSLAQLSLPDMRVPIAYILAYPERISIQHHTLDLATVGSLNFSEPDKARFPLLQAAIDTVVSGQAAQIILNAANEAAVALFLKGAIGFLDIERIVLRAMDQSQNLDVNTVDDVYALHNEVYAKAQAYIP